GKLTGPRFESRELRSVTPFRSLHADTYARPAGCLPPVYRPRPAADGPRDCSSAGGDQGLVADGDPAAQPCLVQSAFEGGLADPGDLGGLLRGESFDVTQHEGGPQRGRQLGQ